MMTIKRFPDGTPKPYMSVSDYVTLRDDDRHLYNVKLDDSEDKPIDRVEIAIGDLYSALFNLRKEGNVQEEYDSMSTLANMLLSDMNHIRKNYKINY